MGRSVKQISSTIRLTITGTTGTIAVPPAHRAVHRLAVAAAGVAEMEMETAAQDT